MSSNATYVTYDTKLRHEDECLIVHTTQRAVFSRCIGRSDKSYFVISDEDDGTVQVSATIYHFDHITDLADSLTQRLRSPHRSLYVISEEIIREAVYNFLTGTIQQKVILT